MSIASVFSIPLPATEFTDAYDDIRNQGKDEKYQQHEGDGLQGLDDYPVDFQYPALCSQRRRGEILCSRTNESLQVTNFHAAGYSHDVDGELQVFCPGRGDLIGDYPFQYTVDGLGEQFRNDETDNERYDKRDA